jgi:hemolysin type calcium-binding protein
MHAGDRGWRAAARAAVVAPVLACLIVLAGAGAAQAAIWQPTRFDDPPDPDACTPTDCSLREAVIFGANANSGPDLIQLPVGSYVLTIGGADDPMLPAYKGDLDLIGPTAIIGADGRNTGIYAAGLSDRAFDFGPGSGTSTISNVLITGGSPGGENGGAIRNQAELTVDQSTLQANSARVVAGIGGHGGAIASESPGAKLTVQGSTLVTNRAGVGGEANGGAIAVRDGEARVVNSTFNGNVAGETAGRGGGVSTSVSAKTVIEFATFYSNSAVDEGGSIATTGSATTNYLGTIFSIGGCAGAAGQSISDGFNLDDGNSCNLTAQGDKPNTPALVFPLLVDNGGPTNVHTLFFLSAAINSGPQSCPPPATDQRGVTRPQGGRCDIGAVERVPGDPSGKKTPHCGKRATLVGTEGDDEIVGTNKADVIVGLGGKDVIKGKAGADRICGNEGNDVLGGGPGNDRLHGGNRNDKLRGNSGRDYLLGGPGRDKLSGGRGGNDRCDGQEGLDRRLPGCELFKGIP